MEIDYASVNPQDSVNPVNPVDLYADPEFRSLMLVSRQRGSARGGGSGPRADLVSNCMAVEENASTNNFRGVPSRGT